MADLASTRVFGKLTVMHEAIVKANAEVVGDITASKFIGDGSQLTDLPWGQLTGVPSTFTPASHTHTLAQITNAGNLAALNTNASTANFLRGDGTWVTPPNTNTTYAEITTAEIDAGTASTLRTISGRRMKYALDKKSDTGHSHVIGDVTGLQAAIDSKANTSTQVIAGTGLSGGGTLAANRTLSVNYGTAAGTAAQGNDSRLSNSREWTAAVVSQAEAEAGTVTTARKWTAQRVRQAILAWWNSSADKTKLDGIQAGAQVNTVTSVAGKTGDVTLVAADIPTLNQSTTGNAATATRLQTARTINGVSFNGSANITVADSTKLPLAGGTLTGSLNAPTFNATSLTGGGFQGIDADTAAQPSFTWTADLNTGIFRPAADVIGFSAGGTERGRINTTGFSGNGSQLTALNASNLSSGTVPNARMSGLYDGITLKINGANTVFTTPSSGTTSTAGRTVFGLAEFRGSASATVGAIVFVAPTTVSTVMHEMEIAGLLYNQNIVRMTIQGYRTSGAWSAMRKISTGTVDVPVRWGLTPDGKACVILGDVTTSWSYPHFSIIRAMFSHTGATDTYCSGWTTGLVTDLAGYTQVSGFIADGPVVGSITGNAATATKLATARTIGGVSFNGTANINLPGVNTAGNQSTTGNAATATKLATARTLTIGATGKTFDGSANVAWSLTELGLGNVNNTSDANKPVSTAQQTALNLKANTSTQVIAGTGLSGGGTLAANRTLSVNYGTAAGTAAQGNDTRIVNATPNSRQIISGTGLTGGGTLAANRTLSVNFATAAQHIAGTSTVLATNPAGVAAMISASLPLGSGSPIGSVRWEMARSNIGDGYAPCDGQLLSRATYPDAWDVIEAGKVPVISDAEWLADPTKRGSFSTGNGSTTFRMPDYNGKSAGTLGAVFLRGDGANAGIPGRVQLDGFKEHKHLSGLKYVNTYMTNAAYGFETDGDLSPLGYNFDNSSSNNRGRPYVSPEGGAETRPLNVAGVWVAKLFGAVVNVGSADAAQLASDLASMASQVQGKLDADKALGGAGQTWQDVAGSRSAETTYTNTTGRPIAVSVVARVQGQRRLLLYVDSVAVAKTLETASNAPENQLFAIIPAGSTYYTTWDGVSASVIISWTELR